MGLPKGWPRSGKTDIIPYLRPDGKSQVTVEYEGDKPVRVDTVVVSTQHHPDVDQHTIRKDIIERVITRCNSVRAAGR
jgi:S-adenosylmethionine synthetase